MNIRSGALLFIAVVLLAPQSAGGQDTAPSVREQKLEKMIRDLTAHINSLEARLDDNDRKVSERESSQVRQLEQLVQRLLERVDTLEGRTAQQPPPGHANVEWGGKTTGSDDLDLGERVAKLEERANRHPNPLDVYWKEGLRLESEDGDFKFKIGGRIMAEGAIFNAGNQIERDIGDLDSGVEFRRARLFILGTIYENVDFKAEFDFADGDADFADVFIQAKNLPFVGKFRVGHFKEPFGLEQLTSSKYSTFIERSLTSEALTPSRNTGFMFHNTLLDQRMTWAVGGFVQTDSFGEGELNDGLNFTGRVTGLPYYEDEGRKLLHVGVAYSHKNYEDDPARFRSRPEAHLAPRFVDTGAFSAESADLIGAELAWVCGSFSMQTEYVHAFLDGVYGENPQFNSFYVQSSYFLTGEHRGYRKSLGIFDRIRPNKNFGKDGWGAWEVAVRYSYLNLDDALIDGGRLEDFTLGLNWYLNPNTRVMFNYVFADVEDSGDASIFQMRFQIDF